MWGKSLSPNSHPPQGGQGGSVTGHSTQNCSKSAGFAKTSPKKIRRLRRYAKHLVDLGQFTTDGEVEPKTAKIILTYFSDINTENQGSPFPPATPPCRPPNPLRHQMGPAAPGLELHSCRHLPSHIDFQQDQPPLQSPRFPGRYRSCLGAPACSTHPSP